MQRTANNAKIAPNNFWRQCVFYVYLMRLTDIKTQTFVHKNIIILLLLLLWLYSQKTGHRLGALRKCVAGLRVRRYRPRNTAGETTGLDGYALTCVVPPIGGVWGHNIAVPTLKSTIHNYRMLETNFMNPKTRVSHTVYSSKSKTNITK